MMNKHPLGPLYREGATLRHSREYYELFSRPKSYMGMGMDGNDGKKVAMDADESEAEILGLFQKTAASTRRGVYMHIPFCRAHCSYCGFYRYAVGKNVSRFVEATVAMLEKLGQTPYVSSQRFDTFYFGGGTPTAIGLDELGRILSTLLKVFKPSKGHEFTVESNINELSPELLILLKRYHVNRISLGVQSFDTETRRELGRRAEREQVIRTVERVRDAKMRTSVDLLYAIPGQTVEDFVEQVRTACEIGVDNISQYRLKVFPNTPLKKAIDAGKSVPQPLRAEWTDMRLAGWDEAERHGYHRWNTKNFGKTETEHCRYTWTHYTPTDLMPTGCGASGQIGRARFHTNRDLDAYCQHIREGRFPFSGATMGTMDGLYLRKLRGVLQQKELDLAELGRRFGVDSERLHRETLDELAAKRLIELDGDTVRLTRLGVVWWPEVALSFKAKPGTIRMAYEAMQRTTDNRH